MSEEQNTADDPDLAEAKRMASDRAEIDIALELIQERRRSAELAAELDAPTTDPRAAVADLIQRLAEVQAAEGHCHNRDQAIHHLRQAAGWLESAGR
ncbi:MAG: hypothetical protein ACOC0Q_08130 [Wenzhouxiangella sp.]